MLRLVATAIAAVFLFVASNNGASAQATQKPRAPAPGAKLGVPPAEQLAILVQTAVVAASQANLTGNYTVLHALGAPAFQKANPPERLARIFAQWRTQQIDLTPVIIYSPLLKAPPVIDDKNMLRLAGYYKTSPQQVHFDLLFEPVAGQWRLFGINLSTQPSQVVSAPATAPGPEAKKPAANAAAKKAKEKDAAKK